MREQARKLQREGIELAEGGLDHLWSILEAEGQAKYVTDMIYQGIVCTCESDIDNPCAHARRRARYAVDF